MALKAQTVCNKYIQWFCRWIITYTYILCTMGAIETSTDRIACSSYLISANIVCHFLGYWRTLNVIGIYMWFNVSTVVLFRWQYFVQDCSYDSSLLLWYSVRKYTTLVAILSCYNNSAQYLLTRVTDVFFFPPTCN